jgi:creatinine amidohydrolase
METIHYADLTWPEVVKLPRHWPLLIPLGLEQYNLPAIARHLSVDQVILLPPVPYGFQREDGSPLDRLQVRPGLLRRVLVGIRRELKTQGFQHVLFINGQGDQGLKDYGLEMLEFPYSNQTEFNWPDGLSSRVVVISTGHIEQHGYHLPISTDTLIVEALAGRLGELAPQEVFCLPAWPYGVSTHTREFPATLNLGGRVFEDFFLAIVDRLVGLGVQMIYFSNGHGGNHSFLVNVIKYSGEKFPGVFTATEWLHTTGPELEQYRQSSMGGMGHGGELETSYILYLRPDLVHMERATHEVDFISTPNYFMDWVEGGSLIANPPWSDDTVSGIYGDATLGSAEKGQLWLEKAARQKVAIIKEIQEQHSRRNRKRAAHSEQNMG